MRVKNPSGIIMRIAIILLCLVLFSSHLASGMFARYSTSANSGGEARVAKVDLQVTSTQTELAVDPVTGVGSYEFSVVNNSEVPFLYGLVITFKDLSYQGVDYTVSDYYESFKLCDDLGNVIVEDDIDGSSYYYDALNILDLTDSNTYVISLKPVSDTYEVPNTEDMVQMGYSYLTFPIAISARATQVD